VPVAARPRRRVSARERRDWVWFALFALPNLALIIAFIYRPVLVNAYYSTLDWTLGSPFATPIGLGNYVEYFTTPSSLAVLRTTAIFTVATVGGAMALGLGLALALNRPLRGSTLARATVFAPYVLSGVGIGLVWSFIFDPVVGLLGAVIRIFGGSSPNWFTDPGLSLTMVVIVYVWKNLGYCAVIYLAGLQAVPADILEAASIDGASRSRMFRSITLPLLSPTTFFLLLTSMLSSLQAFDLIRIMTPSGRGTTTLMYDAYMQAFGAYNRAGFSATVSTILFVILLVMTVVQIQLIERRVHYS
jgi:sn-glycerol 3-phosphate transport system permease protein